MRTEETGIEPRRRMREFSLEREERKKSCVQPNLTPRNNRKFLVAR